MVEFVKSISEKMRDMIETYSAKALLLGAFFIAATCSGSVLELFAIDGQVAAKACTSMAFCGFCLGWFGKLLAAEKIPLRIIKRKVANLPRNQRAVLFAAYRVNGAFRRSGDFSESRAGDDLLALESLGIFARVKERARPSWILMADARRLLDGSERLRCSLEFDYVVWSAERDAEERRHLIDVARKDILSLNESGLMILLDLLKIDGAASFDARTADAMAHNVGLRLLDMNRTCDGCFLIGASAIAREAAPLVLADLEHAAQPIDS